MIQKNVSKKSYLIKTDILSNNNSFSIDRSVQII